MRATRQIFLVGAALILPIGTNIAGASDQPSDKTVVAAKPEHCSIFKTHNELDYYLTLTSNSKSVTSLAFKPYPYPENPVPEDARVDVISQDHSFVEGPVYLPETNKLLFSDIPAKIIYQVDLANGEVSPFRHKSSKSNGNILDNNGFLITCEGFNRRRLVRTDLSDNSQQIVADNYNSMKFNAPNDLDVFWDNSIYFTDPTYGTPDDQLQLDFRGIFRVDLDGSVEQVADGFDQPNGIAFSPDYKKLYVTDSVADLITVFNVDNEGRLDQRTEFYDPKKHFGPSQGGNTDGITVDLAGNVYTSGRQMVTVLNPNGKVVATINVGEITANVAFGGAENRTLFITSRTTVRKVELLIPGTR